MFSVVGVSVSGGGGKSTSGKSISISISISMLVSIVTSTSKSMSMFISRSMFMSISMFTSIVGISSSNSTDSYESPPDISSSKLGCTSTLPLGSISKSLLSNMSSAMSITSSSYPPIAMNVSIVVMCCVTIVLTIFHKTFTVTSSKTGPIARFISLPPISIITEVRFPPKSKPPVYSAYPVATPAADNRSVPANAEVVPSRPVMCI